MDGKIWYCSREDHNYPLFGKCLANLAKLHPHADVDCVIGNDIAHSRNTAVLDTFAKTDAKWIWFIDTDMAFAPTTLQRLISHNVDVVQVLCLKRHPPHQPIIWEDGPTKPNESPRGWPRLVEVQSLGAGGTLYRRSAFEKMAPPWFEGVLGLEDTNFARKLREAGVKLWVDMTTPVGHTTPVIVWPVFEHGEWNVRYDFTNGQQLTLPFPDQSPIIKPTLVGVR